jgi:hypothetical protein
MLMLSGWASPAINEASYTRAMRNQRLVLLNMEIEEVDRELETLRESMGCQSLDVLLSRREVEQKRLMLLADDTLKYEAEASPCVLLFSIGKRLGNGNFNLRNVIGEHIDRMQIANYVAEKYEEQQDFVQSFDARVMEILWTADTVRSMEIAREALIAERERLTR